MIYTAKSLLIFFSLLILFMISIFFSNEIADFLAPWYLLDTTKTISDSIEISEKAAILGHYSRDILVNVISIYGIVFSIFGIAAGILGYQYVNLYVDKISSEKVALLSAQIDQKIQENMSLQTVLATAAIYNSLSFSHFKNYNDRLFGIIASGYTSAGSVLHKDIIKECESGILYCKLAQESISGMLSSKNSAIDRREVKIQNALVYHRTVKLFLSPNPDEKETAEILSNLKRLRELIERHYNDKKVTLDWFYDLETIGFSCVLLKLTDDEFAKGKKIIQQLLSAEYTEIGLRGAPSNEWQSKMYDKYKKLKIDGLELTDPNAEIKVNNKLKKTLLWLASKVD